MMQTDINETKQRLYDAFDLAYAIGYRYPVIDSAWDDMDEAEQLAERQRQNADDARKEC